ncbi:LuxR C-terminal-related transcriptional regulator [Streptomyces sp. NPDC001984]|uniref:helix-turn-helix transcriptional regulator n=1 Tax=Streptomyces sp. NPDC002619 TaxID=3364655 RepID=UPI00367B6101
MPWIKGSSRQWSSPGPRAVRRGCSQSQARALARPLSSAVRRCPDRQRRGAAASRSPRQGRRQPAPRGRDLPTTRSHRRNPQNPDGLGRRRGPPGPWVRSTSRPATEWDALTRTERRVALLVAEGHTNRSAAETLTLSPSTVATHLRSIFTKLSLASRMELTRLVRAQPGTAGSSPATPK